MAMNSIFLFLGVAIAVALAADSSTTSAPSVETAITKICQKVAENPVKAKAYYKKFSEAITENPKAEKNFPKTLDYINSAANENEFLAGGSNCKQYFVGLKSAALSDYQATGLSAEAAKQKLAQLFAKIVEKIQNNQG